MKRDPYICYRTRCRYHAGRVDGNVPSCNYFFATGRTKHSLGEADITRKCGLFEDGPKIRAGAKPIVVSAAHPPEHGRRYDWKQFQAMYDEGKNDAAIGRELGCCADTVTNWRKRMGLPPVRRRSPIARDALRADWEAGMTDRQIAERHGVTKSVVCCLRNRMGLPSHIPPSGGVKKRENV